MRGSRARHARAPPPRPRAARRRLRGREAVLQLVSRLRERAGERVVGIALHPAEDLGRRRRPPRAAPTRRRRPRVALGRPRGERRCRRAVVTSIGPTRCVPQRSCSLARGSSCSYVPIEMCSAPWYAASSALAQREHGRARARAAPRGAPARAARRRARAHDLRATRRVPSIAPSIAPAARTGSRASGSARFTRGRNANASTSRAGPRSSGLAIVRARQPLALARRPSAGRPAVRTAHAHDVGPWTSTPFASAMPPSRIFLVHALRYPAAGVP